MVFGGVKYGWWFAKPTAPREVGLVYSLSGADHRINELSMMVVWYLFNGLWKSQRTWPLKVPKAMMNWIQLGVWRFESVKMQSPKEVWKIMRDGNNGNQNISVPLLWESLSQRIGQTMVNYVYNSAWPKLPKHISERWILKSFSPEKCRNCHVMNPANVTSQVN